MVSIVGRIVRIRIIQCCFWAEYTKTIVHKEDFGKNVYFETEEESHQKGKWKD